MTETVERAFADRAYPEISHGLAYPAACANAAKRAKHATAYILCSGSLAANTTALQDLTAALESVNCRVIGVRKGMQPHTMLSEVLEIVQEAQAAQVLITIGAGSLTDAAKIVSFALANSTTTLDELLCLTSDSPSRLKSITASVIPIISIPTSLSGGEYSNFAGGTHPTTHRKHSFGPPCVGPRLIILDPVLSTTTPMKVWLSTGVRGIDHCVETICSSDGDDESEAQAVEGLRLLVPSLLKVHKGQGWEKARFENMLGVREAMGACSRGVSLGASHGIGHQLGPLKVGHGETSCILLPAVCLYNYPINSAKQSIVVDTLWGLPELGTLFESKGLGKEKQLGELLDCLFRELGMPRTLSEFGIGRDQLDRLAENSLHDRWVQTNPRSLDRQGVLDILEMVL